MNDYREIAIEVTPNSEIATDIIAALLVEVGYESFTPQPDGLKAYIKDELYQYEATAETLAQYPLEAKITFKDSFIEGQDWNEEWEKNYFQPIILEDKCVIHSTFHTNVPAAQYDIVIDPKMAFGTGHHATTSLMLHHILAADLTGKRVLDMGCGTAVLAILAVMRGATAATAIDIDEFATVNAQENLALNQITNIEVLSGGAELLVQQGCFDVVFANINRNILLNDMHHYVAAMQPESELYMSGFYLEDIPIIQEEAERLGLQFEGNTVCDRWVAVKFVKRA